MRTNASIMLLLLALLFLAACVTEREAPKRGMAIRPGTRGTASDIGDFAAATQPGGRAAPSNIVGATLPEGPVARPATAAATIASRVVVEVRPLGSIVYDGQVLPLVSPDGSFLAVEEGDPPTWPVLAALPEQLTPTGTRLAVYDIRATPATRLELPDLQENSGLVLGRSTDAKGFLVESVRDDGSRWIGRASWASGQVEWLAQGTMVCAHGVLTPQGDLLYSRRPLGSDVGELVLRRRDGVELVRRDAGGSYDLAIVADDGNHAVALVRGSTGIDAEAISLSEERPGAGARRLGATISRRRIVDSVDPAMSYQIVAGLQGPAPMVGSSGAERRGRYAAFLHPPLKRMVLFDPLNGAFLPLAPESVAAVRWADGDSAGYFCTTPKDLVFVTEPRLMNPTDRLTPRRDARVLATPLVPRATSNPDRGLIVIGPMRGDAFRLGISAVKVGAPAD